MSMQDTPGGPGRFARRNDLGNVKKIQREGRNLSEASGGAYGERKDIQEISQGAPSALPEATSGFNPQSLPAVPAYAPGSQGVPLSDGAPTGPGGSQQETPVDSMDTGAILARALFAANPTSQLARLVEAYEEMGM
jgi:hypothetical protein